MAARISWSLPIVTMLSAVVSLLVPLPVRADLEVWLEEDGNAATKVQVASAPDFSPFGASFSGYYGPSGFTAAPAGPVAGKSDFMVNVLGGSAANASPVSDLLTSSTSIKNIGTQQHTLTIFISQNDYTLPVGPSLAMTSAISGTVVTGGASQALAFQSYVNNSNVLFDTGVPVATTGPQTPNVSVSRSAYDSAPDPTTLFARTSGEYSVTTTNAITLVVGGTLNFATSTSLMDATTPAPAGLVLALTALPALGVGGWLRRRHRKASGRLEGKGKLAT